MVSLWKRQKKIPFYIYPIKNLHNKGKKKKMNWFRFTEKQKLFADAEIISKHYEPTEIRDAGTKNKYFALWEVIFLFLFLSNLLIIVFVTYENMVSDYTKKRYCKIRPNLFFFSLVQILKIKITYWNIYQNIFCLTKIA